MLFDTALPSGARADEALAQHALFRKLLMSKRVIVIIITMMIIIMIMISVV